MNETNQNQLNILIVEDNPGDVLLIRKMLGKSDVIKFHITHCETMAETLDCLKTKDFDIVLLDLNLSDSEKLQSVRTVSANSNAAIVVFTNDPEVSLALKAIRGGVQDYLSKDNLDADTLLKSIDFAVERQKERNKLFSLAYRDSLTGLSNKNAFWDICRKSISIVNEDVDRMALYIIRLSNLHDIVMEKGLPIGEAYLKAVASRLYSFSGHAKHFARLDGQDFGLLQNRVEHNGHAIYTARRIFEKMPDVIEIMGCDIKLHLNIGIALFPDHGDCIETLYAHADSALEENIRGLDKPYQLFAAG